ncbi:hypothetical protein ACFX1R_042546 [Malus domestica]
MPGPSSLVSRPSSRKLNSQAQSYHLQKTDQKQHQQQDNDARTPSPTAATRGVSLRRHPQGRFRLRLRPIL